MRRHIDKELPGAVVGRLGGDEFVAVLPGVSAVAAEAIGHGLAAVLVDEVEVGLAMAAPGTTLDEVLSLADRAIYGANERGRGVLYVVRGDNQAVQFDHPRLR
jgi:GGDEF domain-containing protein